MSTYKRMFASVVVLLCLTLCSFAADPSMRRDPPNPTTICANTVRTLSRSTPAKGPLPIIVADSMVSITPTNITYEKLSERVVATQRSGSNTKNEPPAFPP